MKCWILFNKYNKTRSFCRTIIYKLKKDYFLVDDRKKNQLYSLNYNVNNI